MKKYLQNIVFAAFSAGFILLAPIAANAADPLFSVDESTYSWGGFHLGASIAYRNMNADGGPGLPFVEISDDGAVAGLEAGYDFQFDRTVVGLIGELTFGEQVAGATNAGSSWQVQTGTSGAVKGRVGYAFDSLLPYVTAGVAISDVETSFTPAGLATSESNRTLTGWTIGAGVEYGLTENWSVKLDYSYADFGSETFRYTAPSAPATYDITTHTVKFGTNLRF